MDQQIISMQVPADILLEISSLPIEGKTLEVAFNKSDDSSHIIDDKVANKHIEVFKVQNEVGILILA